MDVVCLRPSAEVRGNNNLNRKSPKVAFSSQQSDKLYTLLRQLQPVGGYSHTFGALDPVQVIQMGPHLSSVYVSGWQCSSTASTTVSIFYMAIYSKKCHTIFLSKSFFCFILVSINKISKNHI